ncbi:hypothetical protein AC578_4995 [Pseudocercospora eumusae]|uniref:Apple domain-containing protein n=1 Tax=Pseudocercospora eumusae TaxID=321146 RepID=A0A139H971_9PEZI|nr:hypothetical protein AC578_4995 [Pseudocercospora eumusae]
MQPFSLLPAMLLLAAASAQEATWTCPAASNTNATIALDDKNYTYNIQCDTHYFGDEITRFYVQDSNLQTCAQSCSQHQDANAPCKAATVVSMTSTCILRSAVGDIAQRPGLLTAVLESVVSCGTSRHEIAKRVRVCDVSPNISRRRPRFLVSLEYLQHSRRLKAVKIPSLDPSTISRLNVPSQITFAMMRRSQNKAPETLNADFFELLDEADVLKQEIEQAKGNVGRLKDALLQAEQEQSEKECKLDENLSQQLEIRKRIKQLASQAKFESDLQQTPQLPTRKRIKLGSPDATYDARPTALPSSTQDRPGLVPNPVWSQATWKDYLILAKDQVQLNGYTCLNHKFANIVLVDDAWHELFCQMCGANCSKDGWKGDFFCMDALKIHMTKAHWDAVGHYRSELEDSDIVKDFHKLSAEEIKALRSGKMTIKAVRGY